MTYVVPLLSDFSEFYFFLTLLFFQTVSCMPILQYAEALIVRIF